MPQPATLDLYDATQRRSTATMLAVRGLWGRIQPGGDWAAQWVKQLPAAVVLVGSAQIGAAKDGAASVGASLEQSGYPEQALGDVVPESFAGWIADPDTGIATDLDAALYAAVVQARMASGAPDEMLAAGRGVVEALAQTAVADAARASTGAQAVATRRTVAAWYEPPPYCQRCAVLIGKRVAPTTQFRRHPRCDGQVEILSERDDREMPAVSEDQITDLTVAQRRAIADGADMNQVINAKTSLRGGKTARSPLRNSGKNTVVGSREGTRLTPAGIYKAAGGDQAVALELLRRYGYII